MPEDELKKHGIAHLDYDYVKSIPEQFNNFIRKQIKYYFEWEQIAEKGFTYIPKRYLIPIKTASEMYLWTAIQIYKQPFIVFQKQIKPQISTIFSSITKNLIDPKSTKTIQNNHYLYDSLKSLT